MLRRNMTMRRAGVTTGADAPFPVVNPWPKAMIAGEGDKLAAFPLFLDDFPVFLAHSHLGSLTFRARDRGSGARPRRRFRCGDRRHGAEPGASRSSAAGSGLARGGRVGSRMGQAAGESIPPGGGARRRG
jgi:hypothetical protein